MFCRVYTSFKNADSQTILKSIAEIIGGNLKHQQYVEKKGYSIDIRRNDEYDPILAKDFPDGFLFFPYCIEMEVDEDIDLQNLINDVNNILTFLWDNHYAGIVACDFEDQLIKSGGYKSKETPWI